MFSIKNIDLKRKLFVSYIIFCVIPIIFVSQIVFYNSKSNIEETTYSFIDLYTNQISHSLYSNIDSLDKLSKTIYYDREVFSYLLAERDYTTLERIHYKVAIDILLQKFSAQRPNLFGITIVSSNNIYSTGYSNEFTAPSTFEDQFWYKEIVAANGVLTVTPTHYLPHENINHTIKTTTVGRLLKTSTGKVGGVLFFDIRPDLLVNAKLTSPIDNKYNTRIVITTPNNELIYDSMNDELSYLESMNSNDYLSIHKVTELHDLNVYTFVSKKQLFKPIINILFIVLLVVIISIVIIGWFSFSWSSHIAKPIIGLTKSMRNVENGIYERIPETRRKDEIGILTGTYNKMITKMKSLIEDVYLAKIKKKEAELSALQAQINPHMLYNTLESIRMKAAINKDMEVSNMIKILGKMFRLALDRSKNINYIFDEINYIETYIQLQNIRYEDKFKLHINMDDEVLNSQIINLVFQPIIENSIRHGFKDKKSDCEISILGHIAGEHIKISIQDNGCGINPKKVTELNQALRNGDPIHGGSIGIKNIAGRLKLHYGNSQSIFIDSEQSIGTTVQLSIPKI